MITKTIDIEKFEQTAPLQYVQELGPAHFRVINAEIAANSQTVTFTDTDVNFNDDQWNIDDLDDLIKMYYSSAADFFLASTDDSREEQYKFIAEMAAEQEWGQGPARTVTVAYDMVFAADGELELNLTDILNLLEA